MRKHLISKKECGIIMSEKKTGKGRKGKKQSRSKRFSQDVAFKTLFIESSEETVIKMLNKLFGENFSLDSKLCFLNVEYFKAVGSSTKKHVRGDMAIQVENEAQSERVVLEFQSSLDSEMGHRLFVYSLNQAMLLDSKNQVRQLPKGMIIYFCADKKAEGEEYVTYRSSNFVTDNNEVLAKYSYVNLFYLDSEKLLESDLAPLLVLQFYKNFFDLDKEKMQKSLKLIDSLFQRVIIS